MVSVVMAVYNGKMFVKPTIESVLSQTFKDFEFIIVDDGSTDDTLKVIEAYCDDRICLITNEKNMGQTASLNVGLRNAAGTYIARTDAGDISAPERFSRQVRYLETHSNVDILGTAACQYDMGGNLCGNVFMPNRPSTILQRILFACPVVHISVMMRRDRILPLGGYDESYRILADYGLWSRALRDGLKFWNLDEVLVGYLVTPDSFGYSHGRGRSIQEASQIIREMASALTGKHISVEQAEDIYRFFVFGPQDLDWKRVQETEDLFKALLLKLEIPGRDIDYLLLRSYLKIIARKNFCVFGNKPALIDAFFRILSKYRGGLSFHVVEDLCRGVQFLKCRFSTTGIKAPAFAHNAMQQAREKGEA